MEPDIGFINQWQVGFYGLLRPAECHKFASCCRFWLPFADRHGLRWRFRCLDSNTRRLGLNNFFLYTQHVEQASTRASLDFIQNLLTAKIRQLCKRYQYQVIDGDQQTFGETLGITWSLGRPMVRFTKVGNPCESVQQTYQVDLQRDLIPPQLLLATINGFLLALFIFMQYIIIYIYYISWSDWNGKWRERRWKEMWSHITYTLKPHVYSTMDDKQVQINMYIYITPQTSKITQPRCSM